MDNDAESYATKVEQAKRALDEARRRDDPLSVALAESALNDLLDRLPVTLVTRHN